MGEPGVPSPDRAPAGPSAGLIALFSAACALSVANIYYAQPLIGLIAPALGIPPGLAGLLMTLTQLGYGAGLLFVVPLADVVENRRLVLLALGGVILGLAGIAGARSAAAFMAASFVVGVGAVATQVLVPFISHLTPEASRGRVVGNVMGGLLAGIMLARPFASFIAGRFGWRVVFGSSAAAIVLLIAALYCMLPERRPQGSARYGAILRSLGGLVARTPVLRRRALYQGLMFAAFNVFWTGSPLLLARAFGLSQRGIAWFALVGAAGALSAPWAGRMADRGRTRLLTSASMGALGLAFALSAFAVAQRSLLLLVVAALVVDAAVQVCQVLSLRCIYLLPPELRGRLNGLYMAAVFVCGAAGSGLAAAVYELSGWTALSCLGGGFGALAFLAHAFERVREGAAPS